MCERVGIQQIFYLIVGNNSENLVIQTIKPKLNYWKDKLQKAYIVKKMEMDYKRDGDKHLTTVLSLDRETWKGHFRKKTIYYQKQQ